MSSVLGHALILHVSQCLPPWYIIWMWRFYWSYKGLIQPPHSTCLDNEDQVGINVVFLSKLFHVPIYLLTGNLAYLKFMRYIPRKLLILAEGTSFSSTQMESLGLHEATRHKMLCICGKWVYLQLQCQPQLSAAITEWTQFHLLCLEPVMNHQSPAH